MKIESINIQQNTTRSNNSTEPKGDEFTKLLNKIVSNEEPSEKEIKLETESTENDADELLDPMLILGNLMLFSSSDNQHEMSINVLDKEEISIGMDSGSDVTKAYNQNIMSNEINSFALTNNEELINPELITSIEEVIPLKLEDLSFAEEIKSKNADIYDIKERSLKEVPLREESFTKEVFNKDNNNLENQELGKLKPLNENFKEISSISEPEEKIIKPETEKVSKELSINGVHVKEQNAILTEIKVDMPKEVLSNDNLQNIQDTMIQFMESATDGDSSIVKIKLYPEDLGTVDVTLKMAEGKLTAKIMVDSEHIKGLFNGKVSELNESLVKQNIHIEKISVELNNIAEKFNFDLNHNGSFNQGRRNAFKKSNYGTIISEKAVSQSNETSILGSGAISILA